jgi:dihydrofolate synthase/folylpolyglutamate synthase
MRKLVDLIGNPEKSFLVIHVAGTNGKGSVCSMLDSIYRENKYKTGLFTSPHLIELGERVRVNGKMISNAEIESWVTWLRPKAKKVEEDYKMGHPTFFEFMTAIAFLHFKKQNVEIAIFETGLGGRLDSTNVVSPILSIITTISKDHCNILGNSFEEIASEKAGIIKENIPVLFGWLPTSAENVIVETAKKNGICHFLPQANK